MLKVLEELDTSCRSNFWDPFEGLSEMKKAVDMCDGKAITEASGGINLSSVRAAAESGVDLISVGALTHSAPDLDLSLDIE